MHPLLYEINTRCWLNDLSRKHDRPVTLAEVPESEFRTWKDLGFTHVWLMGVWTSGPLARAQALSNPGLHKSFDAALPGWKEADVEGSPYAIASYTVPESLGGAEGLMRFRQQLHERGMRLVLDFVGNHLGLDHPWIAQQPHLFIRSTEGKPECFQRSTVEGDRWFAHGKDPYFPAWSDTVQLDYRLAATHSAMSGILSDVANVCDGVRCDMAMLLLSEVFGKTWQKFASMDSGAALGGEFWPAAIAGIKRRYPGFLFLAEVYWGLEQRLLNCGFDFVYEKQLLDDFVGRDATKVQNFVLNSSPSRLAQGAHFLENHDEPRAASQFGVEEHFAAATVALSLPGMRLLHEGQLSGAKVRLQVQLARRHHEPPNPHIYEFYQKLLTVLAKNRAGQGSFHAIQPLPFDSGELPPTTVVGIQWQLPANSAVLVVVVNLVPEPARCRIPIPNADGSTKVHRVEELFAIPPSKPIAVEPDSNCLKLQLPPHACLALLVDGLDDAKQAARKDAKTPR